eukprot:PhM_4_TR567/c0_g1_i1/m.97167
MGCTQSDHASDFSQQFSPTCVEKSTNTETATQVLRGELFARPSSSVNYSHSNYSDRRSANSGTTRSSLYPANVGSGTGRSPLRPPTKRTNNTIISLSMQNNNNNNNNSACSDDRNETASEMMGSERSCATLIVPDGIEVGEGVAVDDALTASSSHVWVPPNVASQLNDHQDIFARFLHSLQKVIVYKNKDVPLEDPNENGNAAVRLPLEPLDIAVVESEPLDDAEQLLLLELCDTMCIAIKHVRDRFVPYRTSPLDQIRALEHTADEGTLSMVHREERSSRCEEYKHSNMPPTHTLWDILSSHRDGQTKKDLLENVLMNKTSGCVVCGALFPTSPSSKSSFDLLAMHYELHHATSEAQQFVEEGISENEHDPLIPADAETCFYQLEVNDIEALATKRPGAFLRMLNQVRQCGQTMEKNKNKKQIPRSVTTHSSFSFVDAAISEWLHQQPSQYMMDWNENKSNKVFYFAASTRLTEMLLDVGDDQIITTSRYVVLARTPEEVIAALEEGNFNQQKRKSLSNIDDPFDFTSVNNNDRPDDSNRDDDDDDNKNFTLNSATSNKTSEYSYSRTPRDSFSACQILPTPSNGILVKVKLCDFKLVVGQQQNDSKEGPHFIMPSGTTLVKTLSCTQSAVWSDRRDFPYNIIHLEQVMNTTTTTTTTSGKNELNDDFMTWCLRIASTAVSPPLEDEKENIQYVSHWIEASYPLISKSVVLEVRSRFIASFRDQNEEEQEEKLSALEDDQWYSFIALLVACGCFGLTKEMITARTRSSSLRPKQQQLLIQHIFITSARIECDKNNQTETNRFIASLEFAMQCTGPCTLSNNNEACNDNVFLHSNIQPNALHIAAYYGQHIVLKVILDWMMSVYSTLTVPIGLQYKWFGGTWTPLRCACLNNVNMINNLECVDLLLWHPTALASVDVAKPMLMEALDTATLFTAVENSNNKITIPLLRRLLPSITTSPITGLISQTRGLNRLSFMRACQDGKLEIVRLLHENTTNNKMSFVDVVTAGIGHSDLKALDLLSSPVLLPISCLALACENEHVDVVNFLLRVRPDLATSHHSNEGHTCLHRIANKTTTELSEKSLDIFFQIAQCSSRSNLYKAVTRDGRETCLHIACERGHHSLVLRILDDASKNNLMNNLLCATTAPNEYTCAHLAARAGHVRITKAIIERNKSMMVTHSKSENQEGLLYAACVGGNLELVAFIAEYDPAQLESTNIDDRTCLHAAAERGHADVVSYLLKMCPTLIRVTDKSGVSARRLAERNGFRDVAKMIPKRTKEATHQQQLKRHTFDYYEQKRAVAVEAVAAPINDSSVNDGDDNTDKPCTL